MATALDVIGRSMSILGALESGEDPTSEEADNGLVTLNALLDSLWNRKIFVFQIQEESFSWASGQSSRTIGSGGNFSTTRPLKIESAAQTINSVDYPIEILTEEQYRAIPDKTTQATQIGRLYYEASVTTGTLYAHPVPSGTATVKLRSRKLLQSFSTLATDVSLPPGYLRMLHWNLAVELEPEYPVKDPNLMSRIMLRARDSMNAVKEINHRAPIVATEVGYLGTGIGTYHINSDS